MLRLLAWSYLIARRCLRWAKRRFTTAGLFVLIGMALSLGTASTDRTMGMPVFLLLGALIAVAVLMAPFFRGSFTIQRQAPRLATAGEPFTVRVVVRNRGRRAQRGLEYVEDLRDSRLRARAVADRWRADWRILASPVSPLRASRTRFVSLLAMSASGEAEATVAITAYRRGPLRLAGGLLSRTDPLGLFRAFVRVPAPQTVLVMPRRYPLPQLDLPGTSQYQQGGVAMAGGVGESEEFVALRDYRRGDPLKRVHWRSAARTGRLVVKEYQDEFFVRHALVLDTCCLAKHDALFEEAVAVAASFACTIPDQESLLDLLFVGPTTVHLTSGRGVGHTQQMLEVLASVEPQRAPRLDELEAQLMLHRAKLSGCVLVLLAWDAPRRELVRALKATGLPILVLLLVPRGQTAPAERGTDDEQPDRLVVLELGRVGDGLRRLGSAA